LKNLYRQDLSVLIVQLRPVTGYFGSSAVLAANFYIF